MDDTNYESGMSDNSIAATAQQSCFHCIGKFKLGSAARHLEAMLENDRPLAAVSTENIVGNDKPDFTPLIHNI